MVKVLNVVDSCNVMWFTVRCAGAISNAEAKGEVDFASAQCILSKIGFSVQGECEYI